MSNNFRATAASYKDAIKNLSAASDFTDFPDMRRKPASQSLLEEIFGQNRAGNQGPVAPVHEAERLDDDVSVDADQGQAMEDFPIVCDEGDVAEVL